MASKNEGQKKQKVTVADKKAIAKENVPSINKALDENRKAKKQWDVDIDPALDKFSGRKMSTEKAEEIRKYREQKKAEINPDLEKHAGIDYSPEKTAAAVKHTDAAMAFLNKKVDDRNNSLTNAARGRDASGVNEDEVRENANTLDNPGILPATVKPEVPKVSAAKATKKDLEAAQAVVDHYANIALTTEPDDLKKAKALLKANP